MAQFQAINSSSLPCFPSPVYGELYEATDASPRTQDIATADTYQGWKDATAGPLRGMTADVADATADHLTVPSFGAGSYDVSAKIVWSIASDNAQDLGLEVYVNGVGIGKTNAVYTSASQSYTHTTMIRTVVSLSAGDEISLYYTTSGTNGWDFTVRTVSLLASRIGE
jgi:hypothetical protein